MHNTYEPVYLVLVPVLLSYCVEHAQTVPVKVVLCCKMPVLLYTVEL